VVEFGGQRPLAEDRVEDPSGLDQGDGCPDDVVQAAVPGLIAQRPAARLRAIQLLSCTEIRGVPDARVTILVKENHISASTTEIP
jgi:hypothetical protein